MAPSQGHTDLHCDKSQIWYISARPKPSPHSFGKNFPYCAAESLRGTTKKRPSSEYVYLLIVKLWQIYIQENHIKMWITQKFRNVRTLVGNCLWPLGTTAWESGICDSQDSLLQPLVLFAVCSMGLVIPFFRGLFWWWNLKALVQRKCSAGCSYDDI